MFKRSIHEGFQPKMAEEPHGYCAYLIELTLRRKERKDNATSNQNFLCVTLRPWLLCVKAVTSWSNRFFQAASK
jgi:hypothetical protein